jgi:hypothetical protein
VLHALAADGDVDVLHCGPGVDTAKVLASERSLTRLTGCETVVLVTAASADEASAEGDADAEAE